MNGLGHCGSCHTPRNRLGAERSDQRLDGGVVEGWRAYALDRASPAPLPWNLQSLQAYFRDGRQADHGVAHGPMGPIAESLAALPNEEISAIATYIAWSMSGREPAVRRPAAEEHAAMPPRKKRPSMAAPRRARRSTLRPAKSVTTVHGRCHSAGSGSRPAARRPIRAQPTSSGFVLDGPAALSGVPRARRRRGLRNDSLQLQLEEPVAIDSRPLLGAPPWPDLAIRSTRRRNL